MIKPPFYVISDTHWYHNNIVKFCNRDGQIAKLIGNNQNADLIDHNEYMVEKWNSVVGPDDKILHLGDLCLWRRVKEHDQTGWQMFKANIAPRLNGEKYLILGNHDDERIDYSEAGFTVLKPFEKAIDGKLVSFSHYPLEPGNTPSTDARHVHGHIHNNGYAKVAGEHGWRYGTTPTATRQINVSVEMINYIPQSIVALINGQTEA